MWTGSPGMVAGHGGACMRPCRPRHPLLVPCPSTPATCQPLPASPPGVCVEEMNPVPQHWSKISVELIRHSPRRLRRRVSLLKLLPRVGEEGKGQSLAEGLHAVWGQAGRQADASPLAGRGGDRPMQGNIWHAHGLLTKQNKARTRRRLALPGEARTCTSALTCSAMHR